MPEILLRLFRIALVAGAMAEGIVGTPSPAEEPPAPAAPAHRYTTRKQHDPNGTGKFYMGREIALVMGHQGISWLERPQREQEEGLSQLVDALKIEPGMVVADIGAGSGVISVIIAQRLGETGRVLAVDIQQEMLDALTEKCRLLQITNIEPVRGTNRSPRLDPASVDLAFMVDVYHEFDFPYEMLKGIADSLKPGGRLAFVEYRKEDPAVPIKEVHKMYEMQVRMEAAMPEYGLVWKETDERLPQQHVIIFEKTDPSKNGPVVVGGEWPQFRGPRSDNHVETANLPLTWSETENIAWTAEIPGRGWSSPVICGRQIWMTTATDEGHSLRAVCIDRFSGELLQNIEVFTPEEPCDINEKNSFASPTAVVEPGRVYVHFGSMGTAAISAITGEILWKNESLKVDHKEGPGGSPILVGDRLVILCDGMDEQYVAVLDKQTGEVSSRWSREQPLNANPDFRKAFATPLAVRIGGTVQLLCPGADQLEAHTLEGPLWNIRYSGFSNVPQPLYSPDLNLVFQCTGFMKPELWAIRPDGQGDVTESNVAWKFARQVPAVATPVLVGEHILMVHDQGVATCVNARTGEQVWQRRLGGAFTASPLAVGDRIYFIAEDGKTTVVRAGQEFEILGESELPGPVLASPAVAGDVLFLRTAARLYAIRSPDHP